MTEPSPPWYRRSILPRWIPTWLAVAMLIAIGFALSFGFFLDDANPFRTAAVAGLLGFGIALLIQSVAGARLYRLEMPNPIAPPAYIGRPILTALLVCAPLFTALQRRLSTRSRTILTGDAAEALGLLGLFLVAGMILLAIAIECRRLRRIQASMAMSLGVAVVAFGYAAVRAVQ